MSIERGVYYCARRFSTTLDWISRRRTEEGVGPVFVEREQKASHESWAESVCRQAV